MKKTIAILVLSMGSTISMAQNLDCYNIATAKKELSLVGPKDAFQIKYNGRYNPSSTEQYMKNNEGQFLIQEGEEYFELRDVSLTENRFGKVFSAYRIVETPSRGTTFDDVITLICE